MKDLRCIKCKKLLARYARCERIEIKCPRCGHMVSLYETGETASSLNAASQIGRQRGHLTGLG